MTSPKTRPRWEFRQLTVDRKNVLLIQAIGQNLDLNELSSIDHINKALPKLLRGALSAFDDIVVRDINGVIGMAQIGSDGVKSVDWKMEREDYGVYA